MAAQACMLTRLVKHFPNIVPMQDMPLSYAIATFTEAEAGNTADGSGCYTSLRELDCADAAREFVSQLELCRPPEAPGVEARGGREGSENHKAALFRLTDLDPSIPTIGFLITVSAVMVMSLLIRAAGNMPFCLSSQVTHGFGAQEWGFCPYSRVY